MKHGVYDQKRSIEYCVWAITACALVGFFVDSPKYDRFLFIACGLLANLLRYFLNKDTGPSAS